jgi:pimeloyl-ACP methyl ester carboxylesterase
MMNRLAAWILVCALAASTSAGEADSRASWVQGNSYRLKTAVFRSESLTASPTLVIVLHGDSPNANPDYQDRFASSVARAYPNTIAAAILRPGYTDTTGHTSDGVKGLTNGDNWNATNTDALAAAIVRLRDEFHSPTVVLVGHSGGAALSANILGKHPGLAAGALLVSCPCDVPAWRAHMLRTTHAPVFKGKIATLSPASLISRLPQQARIRLIVGEQDDVAPPALTQDYAAAARKRGLEVEVQTLPGEGHNILLRPAVLEALRPLMP